VVRLAWGVMTYVTSEARQELLETIGQAIDEINVALAALGAAYEALDERSGDRLEEQLFRPTQAAYAKAKRTHAGFAQRYSLQGRDFASASSGLPSQGVKGFLENAREALEEADGILSELQDSMMPVEVGDPELRAGLADVRETLAPLPAAAERASSLFGR
jgi:hypothetical protein